MSMKKRTFLWLMFALSFWPAVYAMGFLHYATFQVVEFFLYDGQTPYLDLPPFFIVMVVFHIVTLLDMLGMQSFYTWHLWKKTEMEPRLKWYWTMFLWGFNLFALPIFWYFHIQRLPPPREEDV